MSPPTEIDELNRWLEDMCGQNLSVRWPSRWNRLASETMLTSVWTVDLELLLDLIHSV